MFEHLEVGMADRPWDFNKVRHVDRRCIGGSGELREGEGSTHACLFVETVHEVSTRIDISVGHNIMYHVRPILVLLSQKFKMGTCYSIYFSRCRASGQPDLGVRRTSGICIV